MSDKQADVEYFEKIANQETEMALVSTDKSVKTLHLNMAFKYASLKEEAGSL
jgi:hypothetical protein